MNHRHLLSSCSLTSPVPDSRGTEQNKANPCYHGAYIPFMQKSNNIQITVFAIVSTVENQACWGEQRVMRMGGTDLLDDTWAASCLGLCQDSAPGRRLCRRQAHRGGALVLLEGQEETRRGCWSATTGRGNPSPGSNRWGAEGTLLTF